MTEPDELDEDRRDPPTRQRPSHLERAREQLEREGYSYGSIYGYRDDRPGRDEL